jgi:hypothetical protein
MIVAGIAIIRIAIARMTVARIVIVGGAIIAIAGIVWGRGFYLYIPIGVYRPTDTLGGSSSYASISVGV